MGHSDAGFGRRMGIFIWVNYEKDGAKMSESKTIYDLKLHEILVVEDSSLFTTVMAVDGGWIYRSYDKSCNMLSIVFVPAIPYGGKP